MNWAQLSIRRPVFVTCIFLLILALGALSYGRLATELYPTVNFPVVNIVVPFPGAGPEEVENQVSKPLENALSGIPGMRTLRSVNIQGASVVTTVFTMDADPRASEQAVTQALGRVRGNFPSGTLEPSMRTIDPSDVPLMTLGLTAQMPEDQLYDMADRELRPRLQQLPQIGLIEIEGGRRREIDVDVNRDRLLPLQMTVGEIVDRVGHSGMNIPSGQIDNSQRSTLVRTVAQFDSLADLARLPIRFIGNEAVTRLSDVATIHEGLSDEQSRVYVGGKRALAIKVYRQKGGDALAIAGALNDEIAHINAEYAPTHPGWDLSLVHDGTKPIRVSVNDATQSIKFGVALTILVVFFFLGSVRSTVITGVALPNSLLGAFLLMWVAGFSLNLTTLAALSLAVGLLIDDAIVVRESIFKHIEAGAPPSEAAVSGTRDVTLAVIATTLTVLSVFGPVAFLHGVIGQFFKEFGLTICFAMLISLLDSLTVAPMLSAYFAGNPHAKKGGLLAKPLAAFERFQSWQERVYLKALGGVLKRPLTVIGAALIVFFLSFVAFDHVPKSFVPPAGAGEYQVLLDSAPGTSLQGMDAVANRVDAALRARTEVDRTVLTVGNSNGESNRAQILVLLKDQRKLSTAESKEQVREQLQGDKGLAGISVGVQDIVDIGGGAGQPFALNITGQELPQIRDVALQLADALRKSGDLKDVDTSYRTGASELQVAFDPQKVEQLGASTTDIGQELRLMLSGHAPARFHRDGEQYDIRVRLREDQRDLLKDFGRVWVPNLNHRLVPLSSVAHPVTAETPSSIRRENRRRYIEVSADVDPRGRGLGHAIELTRQLFASGKIKLPPGVRFEFAGQTRDFQDLLGSAILAGLLSIGFMYFVLASLYESFFIPLTIMLVLPLAICGAFYALFFTRSPLEINSMIGCILLMGVAAKNSILLVDHVQEGLRLGHPLRQAILDAGRVRLRPIMMTSFALIAGMLPVAVPLEEAARQRAGMAVAVIGGVVSSTLLTLIVVPAAYPYLLRFEAWVKRRFRKLQGAEAAR